MPTVRPGAANGPGSTAHASSWPAGEPAVAGKDPATALTRYTLTICERRPFPPHPREPTGDLAERRRGRYEDRGAGAAGSVFPGRADAVHGAGRHPARRHAEDHRYRLVVQHQLR